MAEPQSLAAPLTARWLRLSFAASVPPEAELLLEPDTARHRALYGSDRQVFGFGEPVFLRVYQHPLAMRVELLASDGEAVTIPDGEEVVEEDVLFAGSDTARLRLPCVEGAFRSVRWLGRTPAGFLRVAGREVQLAGSEPPARRVAVVRVRYLTRWRGWRVTVPPRETEAWQAAWPVGVLALGHLE